MIKKTVLFISVINILFSCSKEKEHLHYEAFQEEQIEQADAQKISVPIFLAKEFIPKKYEKQKALLKHVKSAKVFISKSKDENFDQELTSVLKQDAFKPLLYIKSKGEMISIYHKISTKSDKLHDFVIYVNDPEEKAGLNITTDINPEELAGMLKTVGIHDIKKIKKLKKLLKQAVK